VLKHFSRILKPGDSLDWLHLVKITEHVNVGWGPLLLVIYAGSQIASTFFMSAAMNKGQRYLMMGLPLVFITFIMRFPAGLVLYWATTNLWTVGQGIITRRLMPKTPAPNPFKRTSKAPPKSEDGGAPAGAPAPGCGGRRRAWRPAGHGRCVSPSRCC